LLAYLACILKNKSGSKDQFEIIEMKKIFLILFSLSILSSLAQLSQRDHKIIAKAEKFYEKGNLYKAIAVFTSVLERNKYQHDLWDLMLKYQRERLENTIAMDPKNNEDEKNRFIALDMFVKDYVFTLMDAIHYYKNLEELCCNVQVLVNAGELKSYERDFSSTYKEIFKEEMYKLNTTCR